MFKNIRKSLSKFFNFQPPRTTYKVIHYKWIALGSLMGFYSAYNMRDEDLNHFDD